MYVGDCPHSLVTCESGSIDIFNLTDKDISLFLQVGDEAPKVNIAKDSVHVLDDIAGYCNNQMVNVITIEYK